jgi:hypothetical protein
MKLVLYLKVIHTNTSYALHRRLGFKVSCFKFATFQKKIPYASENIFSNVQGSTLNWDHFRHKP